MASNVTYNLNNFIEELVDKKDSVAHTAFMNTLNENRIYIHDLLWEEASNALENTGEYDIPEFSSPLKEAVYMENTILVGLSQGKQNSIVVTIDLDRTAGRLEDYASAVETARDALAKGGTTPAQASAYWRYFIYGQGREGMQLGKHRKKGQLGRTPRQGKEGTAMYQATINERIKAMGTLAPFWELIDKGNAIPSFPDHGGTPYPVVAPTNFVITAMKRIESYLTQQFDRENNELFARLEIEDYGENGILDQIVEMVETLDEAPPRSWTPGRILKELEIGEREYKIYITSTRKLGLSLL